MSEHNIQIREAVQDDVAALEKELRKMGTKIWKRVSECRRPGMNI